MNAYELPWFDPEDEAELRAEDALNAPRTDVLEFPTSRHPDERASVVPNPDPLVFLAGPSGRRSGCLDNIPRPSARRLTIAR